MAPPPTPVARRTRAGRGRDPAPATPEADNAGPWRVTRLHGAGDPRRACIAAGERPPRFSFRESDHLPTVLTVLANLRTQPQALAHFLLAVPDEVLRRCGVILARMAREGG